MGYAIKLQGGGGRTYCCGDGNSGYHFYLTINGNFIKSWSYETYSDITLWDDDYITIIGFNLGGGNQGRRFIFNKKGWMFHPSSTIYVPGDQEVINQPVGGTWQTTRFYQGVVAYFS